MAIPLRFRRTVEDSIVLSLLDVANELGRLGEEVAAKAGLTTQQWLVLLQVAGDPNFASPKGMATRSRRGIMASEIAHARGVSRANVSALVAQLLRRGLIRQEEHPDDRRRKHLVVTDAGRKAVASILPSRSEANRNLLADLSSGERAALLRALRRCLDRLWLVDQAGGVGKAPPRRPART